MSAAGEGADSATTTSDEASTMALITDGSEAAAKPIALVLPTADTVAAYMAAHVGAQLLPAGCLTSSVSGATVTYVFNDCTGPRGLVHLTGTVNTTYSVDTAIHANATATDFAVNQSTISFDSNATYTPGTTRSLAVTFTGSGTGPLGNSFNRQGNYTVSWTATCSTLDGTWSTSTTMWTRSTTVSSFTRCQGACPANGGTIAHTYRDGVTVTITFDGTNVAHWSSSSGRSGTVNLTCIPAA
jgi:hypothetical protein